MLRTRVSVLAALLVTSVGSPLSGQSLTFKGGTTIPFSPSQRAFAEAYLKAISGSDIRRYKELLHPATRACIENEANTDYFSTILARRVRQDTAKPKMYMMAVAPEFPMFDYTAKQGLNYPVRPTHALNIDLTQSATLLAFVVSDGTRWYEVLPCPSAQALENMKQAKLKGRADNERARVLAAELKDPLRSEIMGMVKQRHLISAAKRYSEATNVDLTMAYRVVDVLDKPTQK